MTIRKDGPDAKDDVLGPDGRFTREWFRFLADDRWRETPAQTITNATVTTVAHGFDAIPTEVYAYLSCVTADLGYAVGDRVLAPAFEDASDYGIQTFVNGASIGFVVGANGIRIMDRTGGTIGQFAAITNARWSMILRARP